MKTNWVFLGMSILIFTYCCCSQKQCFAYCEQEKAKLDHVVKLADNWGEASEKTAAIGATVGGIIGGLSTGPYGSIKGAFIGGLIGGVAGLIPGIAALRYAHLKNQRLDAYRDCQVNAERMMQFDKRSQEAGPIAQEMTEVLTDIYVLFAKQYELDELTIRFLQADGPITPEQMQEYEQELAKVEEKYS